MKLFADIVADAVDEAVAAAVKSAYVAGMREGAARASVSLPVTQHLYAEAPILAEVYVAELAEDRLRP